MASNPSPAHRIRRAGTEGLDYRSRVRGFLEVHGWRSIEQEGNGGGSRKGRTSGAGRLGCRKEGRGGREEPGEEERAAGAGEVGPARHFSDAGAMR